MYIWIKALHVISIIAWMAGMFYLPRLFVYHAGVPAGGGQSELFKMMERKLMRFIMIPAMLLSWATGLTLAFEAGFFHAGWFHAKLLAVVLLSGVHFYNGRLVEVFAEDRNVKSSKFYRFYNEAPTVLMIAIVTLVIVKPF